MTILGMLAGWTGASAAEMSVGGPTVVCVTSPNVTAQVTGGHGYGAVPPARGEMASRETAAPPKLALVEPGLEVAGLVVPGPEVGRLEVAGPEVGRLEVAGPEVGRLEFAEIEFAVIDLETTGWSPAAAAITEVAAVRVRGGQRQGEFAALVNPGVPVPPGIEDLTGISDGMLAAAPKLPAVLPGLLEFAHGCVLVAHNAPFDVGFLRAACAECGLAWRRFTVLDTVMLARQLMDPDEVPDCKLGTLAGFFRARTTPSHRALADARATADVLGWLIRRLTHRGIRTLDELRSWPDVVAVASGPWMSSAPGAT
jgi:DNA polymerase III epsilon subunit family exonuclease